MNKPFIHFVLLAASSLSFAQTLTSSSMLEDFDALRSAIYEAHGGLYRYADKQAIDQHFQTQRARLNAPLSKYKFIAVISETLAGLHDGHMRLEYDDQTNSEITGAKMLPLRIAIENSKAIVVFNDTKSNSTIMPGMEITSINGRSASDLIATMMPNVSGDGYIQTGKLYLIARNFAMYYWLFVDQTAQFQIEAKDANGKTVSTTLPGMTNGERSANRSANPVNSEALKNVPQVRAKNIVVEFNDENKIATISIRGFEGGDFTDEIDAIFEQIKQNKTAAVILDLRGNGGGADLYGAHLVAQFTDKPFRYFDHIHLRDINPSFTSFRAESLEDLRTQTTVDPQGGFLVTPALHPGVGIRQPGKNPFKGKLIVLMNGGTFSTAADVTAVLHNMKRGVFVGGESGGGYEGNTSGTNARITLPNSKLSVRVQMYDYYNAVSSKAKGRGTIPDHAIPNRMSDILAGADAQMSLALKLARDLR